MILNAPLLFETALLMLAAFLTGAVIGLALRWTLARPKAPSVTPVVEAAAVPAAAGPELVKAPEIAPLPAPRPTAAQRLAAAAAGHSEHPDETSPMPAVKMPEMSLPQMPAIIPIEPSHVAGETVGGQHIDNPEHPHSASLDEVRAELVAQIETAPAVPETPTIDEVQPEPAVAADADGVPEAPAASEPDAVPVSEAPQTDAEAPLAEVSDADADESLPIEERVEPEIADSPIVLTDAPEDVAEEIQDVVETTAEDPVPDVIAETPLVEPTYEKEEDEARADRLFPEKAKADERGDDELAAMRAIEGGWTPRRPASARAPADVPEGVSAAEVAAADLAVANSSAAVANATAMATAVLEEIAPARQPARAGGFGRPASLSAPRDGGKDDFSQIKGLGPAIESSLNGLGIYHYDQIADWDQKAVVWIENHFGFKGRIARERWQEQARHLARGRVPVARPLRR